MKNDAEDIEVKKRRTDKVYFESTFLQQLSDTIDFLSAESKEILKDLDVSGVDEFDLKEFGEETVDQIDDILYDMSKFKDEVIDSDELPVFIKESSRNAKLALNRDQDYVRRAIKKYDNLGSSKMDYYKNNIRIIELCDKAIDVNKSNFDAHYLKGLALINLEEFDEGIDELINALVIDDNINVWLDIANANRLSGEFDDAIDVYDRVLSVDENEFEALKGKAYVYFDWQDYKKCDEFFKKANSIEYLDEESMKTWGICLENIN